MKKTFGHWISRHHILVLIIASVLLIPSYFGIKATGINYDVLDYLPKDLDSTKGEEILDTNFHNASTSMLILDDPNPAEILKIKEKIGGVDGVADVIWRDDLLDVTVPDDMLDERIRDAFYSEDSTLLFIKLEESSSSEKTQKAVEEIRDLIGDRGYLSGSPPLVKDTKNLVDKETPIYVGLAVLFSVIVLSLCTESTLIPFLFLLSIGYAIAYNMGTNIFFGEISYITKAIAAVLQLAVTMDYSIFLYHRYEEERKKHDGDHITAMGEAIDSTFTSIIGSSLTTVAGFLAIVAMRLTLGRDIGLVMVKGVLFGLLAAVTVLPAWMLIFDRPIHTSHHKVLLPQFEKTSNFVVNHHKSLLLVFLLLFIPGIYGNNKVEVYYDLGKSLPRDMPSIVATEKLKDDYDMTSTHFLILRSDLNASDSKKIQEKIKDLDGVNSLVSVDEFVGNRIPSNFLPANLIENFEKGDYQTFIINSEYKSASNEVAKQLDDINKIAKEYDKDAYLTGEAALIKDMTIIADKDFQRVNILSIAMAFLIVVFVFKSASIPIILIMAIELAIFLNFAIVYYTHTVIPFVASIIIGTIQLGSTVDYSILLITRYMEELHNHADKYEAMKITVKESARSIVTSGLTFFAATIGVGFYSQMEIVSSMCLMMARGALLSMLVILFLLPAVILFCNKWVVLTTKDLRKLNKEKKIV